jgi:UDP-2,3-diacylglucosamine pyrophosphatase LpxH
MSWRPVLLVSDIHLAHQGREEVAADFARLVAAHPGHEIVLNGDNFNLSCDPPNRHPAESAASMIARQPSLREALRKHVLSGSPLTLLAGNHDAGVQHPETAAALRAVLDLSEDALLRVEPWLVRRGNVHIEHGHLYDPDNAPTHPLALPGSRSEPLGVALNRRFLGAHHRFIAVHQHEGNPFQNLRFAFQECGLRAPLVILQFLAVSAAVCAETAIGSRLHQERREGEARVANCAGSSGLGEPALRELRNAAPRPTHESFRRTFLRLYYDWMVASLAVPAGLVATAVGAGAAGAAVSAGSLGYMILSHKLRARRQLGMPEHLRRGAELVRRITNAGLVVFGHSHREDEAEGYVNLGSFGYPQRSGRPFGLLDERGRFERRSLAG